MAMDPFPGSALAENRQLRLSADQLRALHADARASKRSGSMAGLWLLALGGFLLWGTSVGRVPGSRLKSYAVGAVLAAVGGAMLFSRGMTRGPRAAQAASASTVLDVVEGPIRRERYDRQAAADLLGSTRNIRGSARYNFYLHVGERRFDVGKPAFEAAPDDGLVRVYVLPASDRIVNLERIGDAPPTGLEKRATEILNRRFGQVSEAEHAAIAATGPRTAGELRAALIGRWQAQGMPIVMEFRSDGTLSGGDEGETKRWEALDGDRVRIDGEEQRVETDGRTLLIVTGGPTLRFTRTA